MGRRRRSIRRRRRRCCSLRLPIHLPRQKSRDPLPSLLPPLLLSLQRRRHNLTSLSLLPPPLPLLLNTTQLPPPPDNGRRIHKRRHEHPPLPHRVPRQRHLEPQPSPPANIPHRRPRAARREVLSPVQRARRHAHEPRGSTLVARVHVEVRPRRVLRGVRDAVSQRRRRQHRRPRRSFGPGVSGRRSLRGSDQTRCVRADERSAGVHHGRRPPRSIALPAHLHLAGLRQRRRGRQRREHVGLLVVLQNRTRDARWPSARRGNGISHDRFMAEGPVLEPDIPHSSAAHTGAGSEGSSTASAADALQAAGVVSRP